MMRRTAAARMPSPGLHSYFARRHQLQQLDQQTYIRLTPAQQFILDVTA
jgi:hypothetical protein